MAASLDSFGKALVASGLMTADETKAFWNTLPADSRPKDGDAFAKLFVERGKLTAFQAAEILAGRGARLIMGDYVILQEIGAGGMGQVYKARHKRMERVVALKVMSAAAMKDEAAVKRFQREVRAAARLEHPNIVTAYDSGDAAGVKYLVMQFVDGGDLSSLVKRGGPLPIEQAVDYIVQTAHGLAFAHGEGVIHRDIKPANLLLDKKGVVKILDMGLARIEESGDGLTATEQVMGTVDYMSPEQAASTKGVDARADIYSLGCTFWFLLTGKKLYDGDTMIARLMAHRDGPLPSLVKSRDEVPWPLEQAFHKLIAKRADDRFQTMDDAIEALAPFGGSGASPSGMGSSLGMSAGPQDAEFASFLKSVGPTSKSQAKPAASGTKVHAEATAQFVTSDLETDPKSEILPPRRGTAGAKPQASRGTQSKKPPVKLIAAGTGGLAVLVVAGIVLFSRNGEPGASATGVPAGVSSTASTPVAHAPGSTSLVASGSPKTLSFAELLDSPDYVWSEPENLGPNVNGPADDHIISLTNDELRLYFRSKDTAGLARSYEAVRGSPAEPFGKSQFAQPMTTDAYVGGNGLTFVAIARTESNGHDLTIQHRPKLDAPWDKPVNLGAQVNSPIEDRRPTLSHDGLTLLFSTNRSAPSGLDLWISRRKSQAEPFGAATSVGPPVNADAPVQCGVLLADGQTIVFRRGGMLHFTFTGQNGGRSTLPLRNHPFADESSGALGLWFAPDGGTVYFNADRPGGLGGKDIWVTRRVPKNPAGTAPIAGAATPSASRPDENTTNAAVSTETDAVDRNRLAAERVLAKGGRVNVLIDDKRMPQIRSQHELPKEKFQLEIVEWYNLSEVTDADMAYLEGLGRLSTVLVHGTQVTDKGLEHLLSLPALTRLGYGNGRLDPAALETLAKFKELAHLELPGAGVTAADMRTLQTLPKLNNLGLSYNSLAAETMTALGELTRLKILSLRSAKFDQSGLVNLRSLRELEVLELRGTPVTDDGLTHLHGLRTVKQLNLRETKVTAAGVAAIRTAFPNCQIHWDDPAK